MLKSSIAYNLTKFEHHAETIGLNELLLIWFSGPYSTLKTNALNKEALHNNNIIIGK